MGQRGDFAWQWRSFEESTIFSPGDLWSFETLEKKVVRAAKAGQLQSPTLLGQIDEALLHGVLSKEEGHRLQEAELARQKAIAVDDFSHNELSMQFDLVEVKATKKLEKQDELPIEAV